MNTGMRTQDNTNPLSQNLEREPSRDKGGGRLFNRNEFDRCTVTLYFCLLMLSTILWQLGTAEQSNYVARMIHG